MIKLHNDRLYYIRNVKACCIVHDTYGSARAAGGEPLVATAVARRAMQDLAQKYATLFQGWNQTGTGMYKD